MNKVLLMAALVFSSASALATNTSEMTCAQAKHLVDTHGAIVLHQCPGIYDRYVANEGFCQRDQSASPAWVVTKDNSQCFIGYTCGARSHR